MNHPCRLSPLTTLFAAIAALLALTAPVSAVTDQEVGEAIERMQNWFYSQQNSQTGEWRSKSNFHGSDGFNIHGEHVLVTYAMIASGESAQDPRMQKAIRFLRQHELQGTYTNGVAAHVWAALPDEYLPNLGDNAKWLLQAQRNSIWDYSIKPNSGRADHSTTQYGILGLWEFSKRGGKTPKEIWENAVKHFLEVQLPDGGWQYNAKDSSQKSRGSMTAAGLTVLYIALQELFRDADKPPRPIMESIQRGLALIDKQYTGTRNPNGPQVFYYLYCIERVALASGVKTLNNRDWFEAGAKYILSKERNGAIGNGNFVDTAFALGFLARGRIPIWITKLEVPGKNWNNRPNDIYFLTRYLSDLREAELNWQRVSIDEDAVDWAATPVAYLSSDQPLDLSDDQVANLRKYLDLGGLLLANSESSAFTASMQQLTAKLYPGAKLEPLPEDHLLYRMITPVSSRSRRTLLGYSNGARDLIVLTTRDIGKTLQSDRNPGNDDVWKLMTNLYVLATDRGSLTNRLEKTLPERIKRSSTGSVTVARASYDGAWNIEPQGWTPLATVLFNKTGLELSRTDVALDALASADASLVHLAGVNHIELSDTQKQSIKQYVDAGGTVLVETIGGMGDFSVGIEQQLREVFGEPATPVALYEPLLTGQGLKDAFNIRRVVYRPYSVIHLSARSAPRLAAINVSGRPGVIFSHEDLTLGAMGVKRWGLNGYQPESARELLTNIIVAAKK